MLDTAKVGAMRHLYAKFKTGSAWVAAGYVRRGWTAGGHGFDPQFERDVKDFFDRVVDPMEKLWAELTGEEREAACP